MAQVSVLVGGYAWTRARRKAYERGEFDLAGSMVDALYIVQLMLLTVTWLPVAVIMYAVLLALEFKWQALLLRTWFSKPEKPWSARDAQVCCTHS